MYSFKTLSILHLLFLVCNLQVEKLLSMTAKQPWVENRLSVFPCCYHVSRLSSLPNTLSLNAGMDNSLDLAFWSTQMTLILEQHEGKAPPPVEEDEAAKQTPPPGQKPCR